MSEYLTYGYTSGTLAGSASAAVIGTDAGTLVKIFADSANSGTLYYGGSNVSTSNGIPLSAGSQSDWIPIRNLNEIYYIGSNGSQTGRIIYAKR